MSDREILLDIIEEKDKIIKGKETQINFVMDLCVIVKNAKIEKDVAQQIYTILL